jgi:hypothetical protein
MVPQGFGLTRELFGDEGRQGRSPLVDPSILRRRPYVAGLAVVLCFIWR